MLKYFVVRWFRNVARIRILIFHTFNFRSSAYGRKYFNGENFPIYSTRSTAVLSCAHHQVSPFPPSHCTHTYRPVSEATSETVKQLYTSLREIFLETNSTSHRDSRLEHLLLTLGQTVATLVATLRDKEMTFLELEDLMAILRFTFVNL